MMAAIQVVKEQTRQLKAHQKLVVDFMTSKPDNLLLAHNMGTGKTMTAVAVAAALRLGAVVVAPKATRKAWEDECKLQKVACSFFHYKDFRGLERLGRVIHDRMLILDEVHNAKTVKSKAYPLILTAINNARRVIACTGTPIPNTPSDFLICANAVLPRAQRFTITPKQFDAFFPPTDAGFAKFGRMMCGLVSYYYPDVVNDPNYPMKREVIVDVVLSPEQDQQYQKSADQLEGKKDAFHQMSRQMFILDAKFLNITSNIRCNKSERHVIYCNFLEKGIHKMRQWLELSSSTAVPLSQRGGGCTEWAPGAASHAESPFFEVITGADADRDRDDKIARYNSGIVSILLISPALKEGVTLKNTRFMHVVDPVWTEAGRNQITARVARFKSHNVYPMEVTVRHYIVKRANPLTLSTDQVLNEIANRKETIIQKYMNVLEENSIEKKADRSSDACQPFTGP